MLLCYSFIVYGSGFIENLYVFSCHVNDNVNTTERYTEAVRRLAGKVLEVIGTFSM
jgi:hypothetical protein